VDIGIVLNPYSGDQKIKNQILDNLKNVLKDQKVYCTQFTYDYVSEFFKCNVVKKEIEDKSDINPSIRSGMILRKVDLLIVLGGDGTISDVVFGQRQANNLIPIIGIPCGTANAGPLMSFRSIEELKDFSIIGGFPEYILGIDVYDSERKLMGTAFNDVVFSDCIVTTKGKKVEIVKAEEFIQGEKKSAEPSNIGKENTEIYINKTKINPEHDIGQIIVAAVTNSEIFKGKAITGKLCWIPYSEKKAVMVISKQVIIKMPKQEDYNPSNPLVLSQYLFGSEDTLKIGKAKGYLIIDGNPKLSMDKNECFLKLNRKAAIKYNF
jgi:hypothetical protein